EDVCKRVIYHTCRAKHFLNKIDLESCDDFLKKMVSSEEDVARSTNRERRDAVKFIDSYKKVGE
ncbi:hypothetical protein ACFL3M_01755, partial [Patescibacteria group bacterium]